MRLLILSCLLAVRLFPQDCNALVTGVDPATTAITVGLESLHPELDTAVSNLVNSGADVRVRVMTRVAGFPTLEAYERSVERACPEWQAPDGGRKNNLVVAMVALVDRKTGIYFGSQWKPALDSQWPRIQSAIMAPRFRDGDYAGGVAAGLVEIRRLITQPVGAATVIVPPSTPTDLSGLWTVMLWLVLLAGAGLLILFISRSLAARRRDREERLGAQQAAKIAHQEATGLVAEANQREWTVMANETKSLVDRAVQGYGQLGMGVTDPSNGQLTAPQYLAIRDRYDAVSRDIKIALGKPARSGWSGNSAAGMQNAYPTHQFAGMQNSWPVDHGVVYQESSPTVVPVFIPTGGAYPVFVPEPEYEKPQPARDPDPEPSYSSGSSSGGGSSDWGSSSSSDSGGSSDFGSSSGGGGDSSW